MTGVDKLHEAGVLGKGAKVAIVDTGVWYMHPAVSFSIQIQILLLQNAAWWRYRAWFQDCWGL